MRGPMTRRGARGHPVLAAISQREVSEREEAVVSVFHVEGVVGPVAVKPALRAPEGIHEVEERIFVMGETNLHPIERMEGDGGGEEIGDGSAGCGEESSAGMLL